MTAQYNSLSHYDRSPYWGHRDQHHFNHARHIPTVTKKQVCYHEFDRTKYEHHAVKYEHRDCIDTKQHIREEPAITTPSHVNTHVTAPYNSHSHCDRSPPRGHCDQHHPSPAPRMPAANKASPLSWVRPHKMRALCRKMQAAWLCWTKQH